MAEVAAGAVTSLLRVIRSEARLLRLVWSDVKFIKEEMESMNSFLAHLARSAPPDGEHDEQVRIWMNQVRLLVRDCNNCIDLYMYWENPDIHLARGGLRRYLIWWIPWLQQKLVAQHRAAVELRELKGRVREVSERRLRYGVEVPSKSAVGQSHPASRLMSAASSAAAAGGYAATGGVEDDGGHDQFIRTDHSGQRALFSRTLDDYVNAKVLEWISGFPPNDGETMSFAIVAPDKDLDALRLAYETMVFHPGYEYPHGYHFAVLIDIPALHPEFYSPLRPKEILFYILRQLKLGLKSQSQSQKQGTDQVEGEVLDFWQLYCQKCHIYFEKKTVLCKIKENIEKMRIYEKIDEIKNGLKTLGPKSQQRDMYQKDPDVNVLLKHLLLSYVPASQQDQLMKSKGLPKLSASDDTIIAVAKKLREYVEAEEQVVQNVAEEDRGGGGKENVPGGGEIVEEERGGKEIAVEVPGGAKDNEDEDDGGYVDDDNKGGREQERKIYLHEDQYVHILRQVFPKTTSNKSSAMQATNTIFGDDQIKQIGEDQIKQMINESKQEILRELQEGKHDRIQEAGQNKEAIFLEIIDQKMTKIKHEFKEQLKIRGLVDHIKCQLKNKCPLFILKIDETVDLPRCKDTRNALTLLGCGADILIVTTAKDIQQAKEYCYPHSEPIDYSLAGLYYDTVLEITKQQKNEKNYEPKIFRNILDLCESYEFCMKIFTHALYVNPRRSKEELNKLHRILQDSPKSSDVIVKKMFKFSYTDLPEEYKSCLLYLAIFPQGHKIRRSTLIGRWVAEGLIFKEDWPSSVQWANRCFDELMNRCLADPADIGATGNVKSCVVGEPVHGIIATIARKQHILETCLPHHLARHFSVFNDLHFRSSDRIYQQGLSRSSSQVSMLKVLDLEGCRCFGGTNQWYLKDICRKMLLLKYLSLRRTDITQLPGEINNLRELKVLDIRQTEVPPQATASILLLKLKRLFAGDVGLKYPSSFGSAGGQIPHKIYKMVNMEVLCNVKAQHSRDLQNIGKLWQLRKLGVVIDDKDSHLKNLLQTISDLHECLCSLSITTSPIPTPTPQKACAGTPPSTDELSGDIGSLLKNHPKILQSLSIRGTTHMGRLLPLFVKGDNNKLAKVTLSGTLLSQDDLTYLAKLPMLRCVRLQNIACTNTEHMVLTFNKDEFKCLKYLLIEGPKLTNITFENGSACELEKMVLSFTSAGSISGVERLPKLEELELNNSFSGRLLSSFDNARKIAKLTLRGTEIEPDTLQILTKKPNIRSLVLLDRSFGGRQNEAIFTLRKDEFLWLNLLVVNCSAITNIIFTSGSAPRLEKIVSSSSTRLSGIDKLPRLKELEFYGAQVPDEVRMATEKHNKNGRTCSLKLNGPETQD